MARVSRFERQNIHASRLHPTETGCEWSAFEIDGQRYLQISSSGSNERKKSGVTQTYQSDLNAARQLVEALRTAFPELR